MYMSFPLVLKIIRKVKVVTHYFGSELGVKSDKQLIYLILKQELKM